MIVLKTTTAVSLCLCLSAALAQTEPGQLPIQRSDQLTLSLLLDNVLEKYPVYEELPARLEEAAKYDNKASSLLSNSMGVNGRYQTGQIGNNDNLREYEAGLTLPLWRFGERKASRQVARGMELEANTFETLIRWELAGVLRASLWRIALTVDRVAKTEKAAEVSNDLLRGIKRRVELGALPRSDLLQAKQHKLNSEIRLSSARIENSNAIRAYRIITEQDVMPANFIEEQSARTGIDEQHPALIYTAATLERTAAEYRLQKESGTNNPTLLLGVRSERGGDDLRAEESVGFFFNYPFNFGAHVNAERATASVAAATARAENRARRRQLETLSHDAERNLVGAEREYQLARQKNELAQQHLAMSVRALELGEMKLLEFLLIKERAFDAEMEASGKEIEWKSAIAQYNQAVGELP
jgi:cobalt-zinc-cadmium efflux system outer membrane protein